MYSVLFSSLRPAFRAPAPCCCCCCCTREYGARSATSDIGVGWRSALSVSSLYEALEDRQSKLQATSATLHELEQLNHKLSAENDALRRSGHAELQSFLAEINSLKVEISEKDAQLKGEVQLHKETKAVLEDVKASVSVSFEQSQSKTLRRSNTFQRGGGNQTDGAGQMFEVGRSYEDLALEERFDSRSHGGGALSLHRSSSQSSRRSTPEPNTSTAAAAKRAAMSVTSLQKALERSVEEKVTLFNQYQAALAEAERLQNELGKWKQYAELASQGGT
jgi:ribosomal 50S subunit-associated protein YjgA (DUF615 family)